LCKAGIQPHDSAVTFLSKYDRTVAVYHKKPLPLIFLFGLDAVETYDTPLSTIADFLPHWGNGNPVGMYVPIGRQFSVLCVAK